MFGREVPTVEVGEVTADAYLLDVREEDEWVAGHAPGAYHVPMMEVPARLHEVPADADVVVVCRSGVRSGQVVAYLLDRGWSSVRNLGSGMQGWAQAGRPLVSEDGRDPRIC
ncbi:MAG TPA: rhodanese-like domain-containing protein [Micromonosporaceae bacterium]|nr:rhodanese-like domain-containing protein [Micromonosporaceae bacterium]